MLGASKTLRLWWLRWWLFPVTPAKWFLRGFFGFLIAPDEESILASSWILRTIGVFAFLTPPAEDAILGRDGRGAFKNLVFREIQRRIHLSLRRIHQQLGVFGRDSLGRSVACGRPEGS